MRAIDQSLRKFRGTFLQCNKLVRHGMTASALESDDECDPETNLEKDLPGLNVTKFNERQ